MPREIHIQLVVNFAADKDVRKLVRYGRDARGCRDLYVMMLCHCKENLTDGFVSDEELGLLVYPDSQKVGERDANRLVDCDLAVKVDGGYYLPGFLKRNKSKAEVEAISASKAENGRRGGVRSGEVRRGEANAKHFASPVAPSAEANGKHFASSGLNTETIEQRSEARGHSSGAGNPPRPAATPPLDGMPEPPPATETQRAHALTTAYAAAEPMCKFPAVLGVVRSAIRSARFTDDQIGAALLRMAAENRAVTVDALRTELGGLPPSRSNGNGQPANRVEAARAAGVRAQQILDARGAQ